MDVVRPMRWKNIARAALAAGLLVLAIIISGSFTYDSSAHERFDAMARKFNPAGNQMWGFDISGVRQNIFTLALDIGRHVRVIDHGTIHESELIGLLNFITRGQVYAVGDALRWFDIPLTDKQAYAIGLCRPLSSLRADEDIVIPADPWQQGTASWYGPGFHGRLAASGEVYNMYDLTAAHKTIPLGSLVRVVDQRTGAAVVVRINDRGPYVGGRIIDMSYRAKEELGMGDLAYVYLERLDPSVLDGQCP